jgi:hypothetical protein
MIVFGHNSFLLNKCKPSQLGLPEEMNQHYSIERRQRYFHLFWIPVFGIGKIWGLRKITDGQLYNPNPELAAILDSLPLQEKTPWYTFSFLVLGLAAGLIFMIYVQIDQYQSAQRYKAYKEEKIEKLTSAINSPLPYQYYDMQVNDRHVFLKVIGSDQHSILFQKSQEKSGDYSEYKILKAFVADSTMTPFDTVRVLKTDMLNTINKEDDYSFKGHEILKGEGACKIYELKEYPFPVFENLNSGFEEGEFYAILRNIGGDAHFAKLDLRQSNITFKDKSFPENLKPGEYVFLEGTYTDAEPNLKSILKLKNSVQDTIPYDLNIYGSRIYLQQTR